MNVASVEVDMDVGFVGDDGAVTPVTKVHLEPFDSLSQEVVAGKYKITWTYAAGARPSTCQLKVGNGERFEFTVSDHLVAVTKDGLEPTDGTELVVATSSLCAP